MTLITDRDFLDISGFSNTELILFSNYWQAFTAKHGSLFWSVWENVYHQILWKLLFFIIFFVVLIMMLFCLDCLIFNNISYLFIILDGKHFPRQTRTSCHVWQQKHASNLKIKLVLYWRIHLYQLYNRMRGLVKLIEEKYGKNTTAIFRKWKKMEGKISNFKNHQSFLLRCLDKGSVPVSLRLKNLIRTQKGEGIIYKAEKQLLNERIRENQLCFRMLWTWKIHESEWIKRAYRPGDVECMYGRNRKTERTKA